MKHLRKNTTLKRTIIYICFFYFGYFLVFYSSLSHANEVSTSSEIETKEELDFNYDPEELDKISIEKKEFFLRTRPAYQNEAIDIFIENIKNKTSFKDKNAGWVELSKRNDKLVIGCSPAVWCGYTIEGTELSNYGYDVIGLGGAFDTDLITILKNLDKNEYKKIIIFGGVNDINMRASFGLNSINVSYSKEVGDLLDEARRHLENGITEIIFVRVKPMTYGRETNDYEYFLNFNNCANQYNMLLTYLTGARYYDIPYETTDEYSSGYVHYDKLEVYEKLFNDVKNME